LSPAPDRPGTTATVRDLVRWLDQGIPVPGTRFRFGLDPLIGLIPGLGDAVGALLGLGLLVEGVRRRVPRVTLLRMAANLTVDALAGTIPVAGDVFDFFWKANSRNLALLERHVADPATARASDRGFLILLVTSLLLVCAVVVAGAVLLWRLVYR
jgi:hypothetical protein